MLTEEHKNKCFASALIFMASWKVEGNVMLNHYVTGDEIGYPWSYLNEHNIPYHWSILCQQQQKTPSRQCQQELVKFMPPGSAVNSAIYDEILEKLQYVVLSKKQGILGY